MPYRTSESKCEFHVVCGYAAAATEQRSVSDVRRSGGSTVTHRPTTLECILISHAQLVSGNRKTGFCGAPSPAFIFRIVRGVCTLLSSRLPPLREKLPRSRTRARAQVRVHDILTRACERVELARVTVGFVRFVNTEFNARKWQLNECQHLRLYVGRTHEYIGMGHGDDSNEVY